MHPTLQEAFAAQMQLAAGAYADDDLARAFGHLERAHVLGQWYVRPHVQAHLGMLKIGWRRRDLREVVGQLLRIPGAVLGSALGRVPRGNTGGSRVSAFSEMSISPELLELLQLDRRSAIHRVGNDA